MKSKDYEFTPPMEEEYKISAERKEELIKKVKDQVRKGFIAHYQILTIGQNDEEWDFLYTWLDNNNINIRGINGTISGEIPNYTHIPKMGQSFTPEILDDAEQEQLFWELHNFSDKDKKNNTPAYQKIKNKLIEHNMKLAKWVLTWKEIIKIKIPPEDKRQMAYLGLIDAVNKFNPSLGYKFSTYACKAIYRRIIREAYREDGQNIITNEQLAMISDIKNQFLIELGREAKPYEIADILGVSLERVHKLEILREIQQKDSLDEITAAKEDVSEKLSDGDRIIETDAGYVRDGVYMDEEDLLPLGFRQENTVEAQAMVHLLQEDLKKALLSLENIDRNVLIMRFGLNDGIIRSFQEIASIYNVSKERIRQIEAMALRKLRGPHIGRKIKAYAGEEL